MQPGGTSSSSTRLRPQPAAPSFTVFLVGNVEATGECAHIMITPILVVGNRMPRAIPSLLARLHIIFYRYSLQRFGIFHNNLLLLHYTV